MLEVASFWPGSVAKLQEARVEKPWPGSAKRALL